MSGTDAVICFVILSLMFFNGWRMWKLQKAVEALSAKLSYSAMVADSLQREIVADRQEQLGYGYQSEEMATVADHRV